jgi:hypothetical protein
MKIFTLFLLIFAGYISCLSQSLALFELDNSKYPLISAKFYATDIYGMPVTGLDINDFSVKEAGKVRKIISVDCPPQNPPPPLSSVLLIDVSGSMSSYRTEMTKNAAKVWVNSLNLANSECAISTFDDKNYLICDFTNNKNQLLSAINNIVAHQFGGTNYDQALMGAPAGGLLIAKTGINKRIVIFLSDGAPNTEPATDNIINYAKMNAVTIHSISIFLPAPESMIRFSNETGGLFFSNLTTPEQLIEAYKKIIYFEQSSKPCSITWLSEPYCDAKSITADVKLIKNNKTAYPVYSVPASAIPAISLSTQVVSFNQIQINGTTSEQIDALALNGSIDIVDITSDNNKFSCTPLKYSLKKGELLKIDVSYKATDSAYNVAKITVKTNYCENSFFVIAGDPTKPPPNPTIKLIHPNGSEIFAVTSDTVITWQGVIPADTVSLNYSTDSGNSWINITDSATNLKYYWNNIPNTPSDKCLMKVTTKEKEFFNNSAEFDGIDDYLQISNSTILNTIKATDFTVEAWVYIRGFSTQGSQTFPVSNQILEIYNNYITFLSNHGLALPDALKMETNKWYYVAVTYERSLMTAYTYINGIKVGASNSSTEPNLIINPDLLIGYSPWGNTEYANGFIDELRIWNVKRTDAEIVENYNKKLSIPQNGLILYFDFDESGKDPIDMSGFNNTAVFKNGAKKAFFSPVNAKIPSQSDVSDNLWAIVKSDLASFDIDMGICILGYSKDSLVTMFLKNNGKLDVLIDSIVFEGNNPSEFSLVSGFNPFVLKAGAKQDIEFRFNPKDYGLRDAVIKIVTKDSVFYQKIKGTCNSFVLELTTELIDFGIVKVGLYKDSTVVTTLTNKSNADVKIFNTYNTTPNDKDFYIINGGGSFILKPDESHSMILKFKPSFEGKTSGRVAFEFDGPGSPVYLQLFGEGIIKNAAIAANDISYQSLVCDNEILDSVQIRNIGKEVLNIKDFNIDNNNFILLNSLKNIDILPKNSYTTYIKFKPNTFGDINGNLTIFSNADPDSIFKITLKGRKENLDYSLSKTDINLGYLCQNEIKKFSVDVLNNGTQSNKFIINTSSSVTNDYLSEEINSLQKRTINFEYRANTVEGAFNEQIEVIDTICNKKTIVNLKGIIQNPKLFSNDITVESIMSSISSGTIILSNLSDRDITISTMPIISGTELSFDNLQLPIIIFPKQSKNIPVKYIPVDAINDKFEIIYDFEPCDQTYIGTVYGRNDTSKIYIQFALPHIVTVAGSYLMIPINAGIKNLNSVKLNSDYEIEISFDKEYFAPDSVKYGEIIYNKIENQNRILRINGVADFNEKKDSLFPINYIYGKVLLGRKDIIPLTIDSVNFTNKRYFPELINGSLEIASCVINIRPIQMFKPTTLSITPNPTDGDIKMSIETQEKGSFKIEIFNIQGQSIYTKEFSKSNADYELFEYNYNTQVMGSGVYSVHLTSPWHIFRKQLVISK